MAYRALRKKRKKKLRLSISNFKCLALKTRQKRIVKNPLSNGFWRGYSQ